MTDYLNEFTPDWPHGHVLVLSDGTAMPFVVKVTDGPGETPIWGHTVGQSEPWLFRADGSTGAAYLDGSLGICRLRNVAPPAEVIEETEAGEEKLPDGFKLARAKNALGNTRLVNDAFSWPTTPQGSSFWSGYYYNTLYPKDKALAREALRRWIAIAEKEASK